MERISNPSASVIVVERDSSLREVLVDLVAAQGLAVRAVDYPEQAEPAADPRSCVIVIVDSWECEDYARRLARFGGGVVVLAESIANFERATRLGFPVVRKPFALDDLERAVADAFARVRAARARGDEREARS